MSLWHLEGSVQNYAWGGREYIPSLLGIENFDHQPCAEYWLGSHPRGEASVLDGKKATQLTDFLKQMSPQTYPDGNLPFLLKVLDVEQMLSLQCHPNLTEARTGFRKENELGIPLEGPNRIFRDANHKPEAMIALSEFWLLHGFRNLEDIRKSFDDIQPLAELTKECRNLKDLFERLLSLSDEETRHVMSTLEDIISNPPKNSHDFWVKRAIDQFYDASKPDRGILIIYLLNLVKLQPGDCIFQEANLIHAYLEGQNVEIMATSDNVFRAGLTQKHVDVQELVNHTNFEVKNVELVTEQNGIYSFPVDDFKLHIIDSNSSFTTEYMEVILCIKGDAKVSTSQQELFITRGQALLIGTDTTSKIEIQSAGAKIVRAFS